MHQLILMANMVEVIIKVIKLDNNSSYRNNNNTIQ